MGSVFSCLSSHLPLSPPCVCVSTQLAFMSETSCKSFTEAGFTRAEGSKPKGREAKDCPCFLGEAVVGGGSLEPGGLSAPFVPVITGAVVPHPSRHHGIGDGSVFLTATLSAFTLKQLPRSFEILNLYKECKSYSCWCC